MNKRYDDIDLKKVDTVQVALSLGYKIDKSKGFSAKTVILTNGSKEIFIYKDSNRYTNQHDNCETGDAAQLVINEKFSHLDKKTAFIESKKYLKGLTGFEYTRAQEGKEEPKQDKHHYFLNIMLSKSRANECDYLTAVRKISKETLKESDLACCGNDTALFFHQDALGQVCGYEFRKTKEPQHEKDIVKGFSKGGIAGLFSVNYGDETIQDKLIIVESAINALSLVDIFKIQKKQCNTLICSTGGNLSNYQLAMIVDLAKDFNCTYLAQDNDQAGDKQAYKIAYALSKIDAKHQRMKPRSKDWNDKLLMLRIKDRKDS